MSEKKGKLLDLLMCFAIFLVVFSPVILALYAGSFYSGDTSLSAVWKGFWLFIPTFVIMNSEQKNQSFAMFMISLAISIALAFFIASNLLEKIAYVAYLVIMNLISFKLESDKYINENDFSTKAKNDYTVSLIVGGEIIFFICVFVANKLNFSSIVGFFNFFAFVYILIFMIYCQVKNIDDALITVEVASQPVGQIKRYNTRIMIGFTGLCGVILAIIAQFSIGGFWDFIAKIPSFLSDLIISAVVFLSNIVASFASHQSDDIEQTVQSGSMPISNEAMDASMEFIRNTIMFIIVAIIVVAILVLVVYIAVVIYKRYLYYLNHKNDLEEFVSPFKNLPKKKGERNTIFDKIANMFDSNNNLRIRKIYFKRVKQAIRTGVKVKTSDTSGQIANNTKQLTNKDLNVLTEVYNKARYSYGLCSNDEVNKAKWS